MKTAFLHILVALASGFFFNLQCYAQVDDFNDGNALGWQQYNPIGIATFSVVNGAYRIQSPVSPDPVNFGPARAGSLRPEVTYSTNFYVSVDVTNWNDSVNQSFGLLARITDPGPAQTKGYAFTYNRGTTATSGDVDISLITGESPTQVPIVGNDDIHLVPGRTYRFVFLGIDSTLEGRVYEHPDLTNAVVTVVGTDSTYPSGICGLVIYSVPGGPDATFDNYFATNSEPRRPRPPPQLSIELRPPDAVAVSYPTNAMDFSLQFTSNPFTAPVMWNTVSQDDLFPVDNRFEYYDFVASAPLFFRLYKPEE